MIHYQLRCDRDHSFDGWFKDSVSFDHQAGGGLVACPFCNSVGVSRALMAPALTRGSRQAREAPVGERNAPEAAASDRAVPAVTPPAVVVASSDVPDKLRTLLQRLRAEVEKHCDYVGADFAKEARKIHYGECVPRGIYGETTLAETEALADEGIDFSVMPWLRRSDS